ncbi:MAG: beta-N-acetylhexosaminidase [Rhodospirillales bacterium]
MRDPARPRAVIFGVGGAELTDAERRLFRATDPLGFILFRRNCLAPEQIRALVADLRSTVGRIDAPVLIDQEGGRVQRLGAPHWRAAPPAARFGALWARNADAAAEAVRLNARLIAHDLATLGISHDCAPLLDVPQPDANAIIGDRAFAADAGCIARLGGVFAEALLDGGVLPIIKHLPGHGRATADSHLALPVVSASAALLREVDLAPFRALSHMPWAMTAHVVYTAFDPDAAATVSKTVVNDVIRGAIGFAGVIVSDDICMRALTGRPAERALAALAAGCDVVLHCNGIFAEMEDVAGTCPPVTDAAIVRLDRAEAMRRIPAPFDPAGAIVRLNTLLGQPVAVA